MMLFVLRLISFIFSFTKIRINPLHLIFNRELIEGVSRTRYGVDGRQLAQGSFGAKVQDWLLDIAAAPQTQKPSGAAQNGLTG
jgi:hypothetical protein